MHQEAPSNNILTTNLQLPLISAFIVQICTRTKVKRIPFVNRDNGDNSNECAINSWENTRFSFLRIQTCDSLSIIAISFLTNWLAGLQYIFAKVLDRRVILNYSTKYDKNISYDDTEKNISYDACVNTFYALRRTCPFPRTIHVELARPRARIVITVADGK